MNIELKQKRLVFKIAKEYKLGLVFVFGSFAVGRKHKQSDLDIGIISDKNLTLIKEIEITQALEKIFKYKIDLSILNHANPLHLYEASKNPILLFGKTEDMQKLRLRAYRRYHDYEPFFKIEANLNKRLIKYYASKY